MLGIPELQVSYPPNGVYDFKLMRLNCLKSTVSCMLLPKANQFFRVNIVSSAKAETHTLRRIFSSILSSWEIFSGYVASCFFIVYVSVVENCGFQPRLPGTIGFFQQNPGGSARRYQDATNDGIS